MEWISEIKLRQRHQEITIVHIDPDLWNSALTLLKRYDDKPDISFVDFSFFAVMQKLGIVEVFTGDHHFEKVNLGFQILR